ncbi:MAG TPA: ATP-binding protein [Polyangia bacterium]|nr:ATP-binding protein [Polyangia bacterium]
MNRDRTVGRDAFLAQASALLNSSLDARTILESLAHLAVPTMCDTCIVDMVEDGQVTRMAVAHFDAEPQVAAEVAEALKRYPPLKEKHPVQEVLRTQKAELQPEVPTSALAAAAQDVTHRELLERVGPISHMIVPIVARGQALGTITFWSRGSGRRFDAEDLALAEDLTQRAALAVDNARLYQAERHARSQAEAASRAKDEFVATISHELRTPLTSILGWITLVRTVEDDREAVHRALDIIERNARAQAKLIDDILDISRIITGKLRLEQHQFDLRPIVQSALDVVRPAAEARSIHVETDLEPRVMVVGDPPRVQQVVWNLLSNAIKFTPQNGKVKLQLKRIPESAEIVVTDTGQGISAEFLPYVFDRFSQAHPSRARTKGLGLGLAIARHLVELHGGTIEAQSPGLGHGATFRVRMPLAAATAVGWPERKSIRLPPKLFGLKVLVAEDDPDTREYLSVVLEGYGSDVRVAASGNEAMQVMTEWRPSVLISDLAMAEGDGFELIRWVRSLPSEQGGNVPALALTAYATVDDRVRVLSAGYQMHLPKPIEPDELARVVALLARPPATVSGG